MAIEFTVQIKGANWLIKKLTPRKFKKLHDVICPALTIPIDREIHLNSELYTPYYIRHELFHAYVAECNTESMTDMTLDDMEELSASLVAEFCFDIAKLADEIFSKFKSK